MKNRMRQMLAGTIFEPFARKVNAAFTSRPHESTLPIVVDQNRMYDIQTVEVMKRILKDNSNCIDVGCHRGDFLKEMLNIAPKGTHFAFEPLPDLFKSLQVTFGSNQNVHLFPCALSDIQGNSSFQRVLNQPAFSGLRQRRYDQPDVRIEEITVQTERLDDIVKETPIRFIKIDVEGAELQVFKGAITTIKNNHPAIVFEHGLGAADYYGTTPENIYDLLINECGLNIYIMAEWLEKHTRAFLSKEAFVEQFSKGLNYYFMAAP